MRPGVKPSSAHTSPLFLPFPDQHPSPDLGEFFLPVMAYEQNENLFAWIYMYFQTELALSLLMTVKQEEM